MTGKRQRLVRAGRRVLRLLRLPGFALVLILLLALFHLLVIGLPDSITRHLLTRLQTAGLLLRCDSIRLSTHHGWVLSNAKLYSRFPDDLQPLLDAGKLYVRIRPAGWKNFKPAGWRLSLYGKNIAVAPGHPWETVLSKEHPLRTVEKLNVSLAVFPGRVSVGEADCLWGGINIHAHGEVRTAGTGPAVTGGPVPGEPAAGRPSARFVRRAAQAADAFSKLKFARPPQIRFDFDLDVNRPEQAVLDAGFSAEDLRWRNRVYDRLHGSFKYRDGALTLTGLELACPDGGKLAAGGTVRSDGSDAQLSVENTLSAADLLNLLPGELLNTLAQTGIEPAGRLDFSAVFGPAPREKLLEKVQAEVRQAQLRRKDLTLDPLALRIARDGSRLKFTDIQARANGGTLTGKAEFDIASRAWIAQAQTQCDPVPVGTLTGGGLQEFISRFRFPEKPPRAALTLSQTGAGAPLYITGTLAADRFICGGVPIEYLETSIIYSNRVLHLFPLHLTRGKEKFDGRVEVDFVRKLGFFNVTNSFPPPEVARVIAPAAHTVLEKIRFDGPVYSAGSGQIDYGSGTNHAFSGIFRTENTGAGRLQAARFNTQVEGRGTQLVFTNISAALCGGTAEGSAGFDLLLRDGSAPYRVEARVTRLDLTQVIGLVATGDYSNARGNISGTLNFTADAKNGFWTSVRGGGRIEIKDGRLADIPLFGGFSHLLQISLSLTTFFADYELRDEAVWSGNARLGGSLFNARARGSYSPAGGLDFVLQAEPLRQTRENKEWYQAYLWPADVLKWGTSPLSLLFEFQLEGPLERPEWRFVNLPKEFSGMFQRPKSQ